MNRRVLPFIIGLLLVPLGCGGNDEPTGPTGPSFATLVVATTSLPNAAPTVAYSQTLTATGGDGSYTWSVTVGSFPTGLSLNTSTGLISGTPSGSSSTFTVQVASGGGQTDTQVLSITVNAPLAVTTTSLPAGFENEDYGTVTLTATGADGIYVWSVAVGSLPAGLSLAVSGDITGTTTLAQTGNFTVQVASGDGQTATQQLEVTVVLSCSAQPGAAVSTFVDANLAAAVRTALGIGAQDDLTCGLLSGLTTLTAVNAGIVSLVGLQNLTSLRTLDLGGNSITDISPLSGLTSLTLLGLGGNSITDIGPLSGLTSLTFINLIFSSITDISALSGLTSLTLLHLISNSISDISPLSGLTSLVFLTLDSNSITDISAVSALTSLTRLSLQSNSITDLSVLSGLTSLTSLSLNVNSITDISALAGLTSLTNLGLGANSITDLSVLSGLTSLTILHLHNTGITDLSVLSGLTSLTSLSLQSNSGLSNIQPLLDNTGSERATRSICGGPRA